MVQEADQSLPALLRSLRGDMSRSRLSRATASYNGIGVSEETIKALEAGKWSATPETLRAIAHGLGIEPERFPQYRLALLRQQFDEREVGLDEAISNLADLDAVLNGVSAQRRAAIRRRLAVAVRQVQRRQDTRREDHRERPDEDQAS